MRARIPAAKPQIAITTRVAAQGALDAELPHGRKPYTPVAARYIRITAGAGRPPLRPGSPRLQLVRQLAGVLARGTRICCAARAQFCTAPIARRVEEFGQ